MKFVIVSGSHREGSQTLRVCKYISSVLSSKQIESTIWDLYSSPLPFLESSDAEDDSGIEIIQKFTATLTDADAYVYASPEWDGAATPGTMNALALAEQNIAHKPTLLVAVSASRGGSYPIAQMKAFGSKNNKTVFVPDHIIVHDVKDVLAQNPTQEKADIYIRERIDWSLDNLILYAKSLKKMRESNHKQLFDDRFGNGMS